MDEIQAAEETGSVLGDEPRKYTDRVAHLYTQPGKLPVLLEILRNEKLGMISVKRIQNSMTSMSDTNKV
jgi:hypothetical protein